MPVRGNLRTSMFPVHEAYPIGLVSCFCIEVFFTRKDSDSDNKSCDFDVKQEEFDGVSSN